MGNQSKKRLMRIRSQLHFIQYAGRKPNVFAVLSILFPSAERHAKKAEELVSTKYADICLTAACILLGMYGVSVILSL